jgi:ATP-binding cassette subfamily F protein 3
LAELETVMTILNVAGATIRFAETVLLESVTLTVARGDRWGIVGKNGAGKTSLFELIAGRLAPAAGAVVLAPNTRLAMLDQHREFEPGQTVWDAAAGAFTELIRLEHRLAELSQEIGEAGDRASPELLEEYGHALERFEREDGYTIDARVDAILHGLGFDPVQARTQPAVTLSGGERGRLALARQLATESDLLLLDEPTNHLDLETTAWLESYLAGLDAAVLVVSHDRAFLEQAVNHVLHLEGQRAEAYQGSYSAFVEQRTLRRLSQQRAYEKQSRALAKEEDFIRRNIAGQNSAQARGRQRRLSRMPRLSPPVEDTTRLAVRFDSPSRGGDQVVSVDDITIYIGDKLLISGFSSVIRRGDVVGLVGPNGAGKSTLLRGILGELTPVRGAARLGDSIRVGYYRQDLSDVPLDRTLFDIIHDLKPSWTRGQVHDHLGRFGFSGDAARRRADSLSGGELARMALARLMLSGANLLVFDEPTNHLDVESIEALEDAIAAYDGTVLLVSHDRAFLRALTTRTWALRDGQMEDFGGGFEEWEAAVTERAAAQATAREETARQSRERARAAESRAGRPTGPAPSTQAKRALATLEDNIAEKEARIAVLERELGDERLFLDGEGARRAAGLARELETIRAELRDALSRWEVLSLELEALEQSSQR